MFCSFLALVLKAELEARMAALGQKGSWPAIIGDLDALTEIGVEQDGRRFMPRSAPRQAASLALRAFGRRTAIERAVDHQQLIANREHVVSRCHPGADSRFISNICTRALSKMGLESPCTYPV